MKIALQSRLRKFCLLLTCLSCAPVVFADEITLLATMGSKGVFQVNGQKKSLQVGQKQGEFKVIAIAADSAVVEAGNGRQRRLGLGEGYVATSGSPTDSSGTLVLSPVDGGHYFADITINNQTQRGVIDTGATHLSMTSKTASSLKIDYSAGRPMLSQTANGTIRAWLTQVPQLKMGTITLYNVELSVREGNENGPILIGMSLLNRFQMKREQELMFLTKKTNQ